MFVAATGLLYLVGARSWVLLLLAFLISGIASYVLLSGQRDKMSAALAARRSRISLRARLEQGARAEDTD